MGLLIFYSFLLLICFGISMFALEAKNKSLYAGSAIVSIIILFVVMAVAYDYSKHLPVR